MGGTVLITGCSRGIGLGLVKEFLTHAPSWQVIGVVRQNSQELYRLIESHPLHLRVLDGVDVRTRDGVERLKHMDTLLDLLVNNVGIATRSHPNEPASRASPEDMLELFKTNVVGTMLVTQALTPLLKRGSMVVNVSSSLGSIERNVSGGVTSYRCSKAALNQLTKCFALELANEGIGVVAIDPGWVQTDMGNAGGRTADLTVEHSCKALFKTITGLTEQNSGQFLDHGGSQLPW